MHFSLVPLPSWNLLRELLMNRSYISSTQMPPFRLFNYGSGMVLCSLGYVTWVYAQTMFKSSSFMIELSIEENSLEDSLLKFWSILTRLRLLSEVRLFSVFILLTILGSNEISSDSRLMLSCSHLFLFWILNFSKSKDFLCFFEIFLILALTSDYFSSIRLFSLALSRAKLSISCYKEVVC